MREQRNSVVLIPWEILCTRDQLRRKTIRVVDPGVVNYNIYPFIPRYLLDFNNFSVDDPYSDYSSSFVVFVNCEKPVNSPYHLNISPCVDDGMYSPKRYRYVLMGIGAEELGELCQVDQISLASWSSELYDQDLRYISCTELVWDFELSWGWHRNGAYIKECMRPLNAWLTYVNH
jgi:hypothetical protein